MKRNEYAKESPRAALYLRLSRDDGTAESASIATQRSLLRGFAKAQGFQITNEYVDDGYSGTNFDRPAFSRMLRDIEAGRIDIVLTKDLSRLGRDYITAGQFTEQYFPAKGIRYIAVNDGYDSEQSDADIVPFKNILNEMYARDISKKIRSSFRAKMMDGKYIAAFAPYGYRKDPADRNRLLIDPQTGNTVREIFRAAARGDAPSVIAKQLNAMHLPAPLAHRALSRGDTSAEKTFPPWSASTVTKLLHSEVYCGHSVQGKSRKISFKNNRSVPVPSENRITVRNTHTPLIDEDTFLLVQRYLHTRIRKRTGGFSNLFSGIAFCADCAKAMSSAGTRKKDSPATLTCGAYKLRGSNACSNHFIDYRVLERIVLAVVQDLMQPSAHECSSITNTAMEQIKKEQACVIDAHTALLQRQQTIDRILTALYEDHASGRLSNAQRDRLLSRYTQQMCEIEQSLRQVSLQDASPSREASLQSALSAAFQTLCYAEALSPQLLFTLIDRIEIGQGTYEMTDHGRIRRQKITIRLRFQAEPSVREFRF